MSRRIVVAPVLAAVLAVAAATAFAAADDESSVRQLQDRLQQTEARLRQLEQMTEAMADALESASFSSSGTDKLSVQGYGEMHYNNLSADDSARDKQQIDFHRFVLFFGYEFSERLSFFSEFELEHSLAGDGKPGEVELEQGFIEYSFSDSSLGRVGLFLVPVGILNETHEPPTFYGVERNNVENIIIPATWWAGGAGYSHRGGSGFSLDFAVHEGLAIAANKDARVRSGRQKTAEAQASHPAATFRLKYTGLPGLELSATAQYQTDITQQRGDGLGDALLYELHAIYASGPFAFRGLYAAWDMSTEKDQGGVGAAIAAAGSDAQSGWYAEPSIKLSDRLGVFARYEKVKGGRAQDRFEQLGFGLNYWPVEEVVLKMDYADRKQDEASASGRSFRGFNLGFGYYFRGG